MIPYQRFHPSVRAGLKIAYYGDWLLIIERKGGTLHCWLCPSEPAFVARCRERFEPMGFRVAQQTLHRWFDVLSVHLDELTITTVSDAVKFWDYSGDLDNQVRELFERYDIIRPPQSQQTTTT